MPDSGGTTPAPTAAAEYQRTTVRGAWSAAAVTLAILSFSYGSPLLVVVGLKPITASLGTTREVVALAAAVTWLGTGTGGIFMGWLADRIGIRRTVMFGATMIAAGLAVSAYGKVWALLLGHGILLGFLGNGAMMPPLMVYVSRWFEARRGTALALISSGQYVGGIVWPSLFEHGMAHYGWQPVMIVYGLVCVAAIVPLALLFLHPAPDAPAAGAVQLQKSRRESVLRLPANLVMGILCVAGFCCCVPMALPQSHLVAFCSDVGISAAGGAAMLSVLQGCAFASRQFWGWLADRIGGLPTLLMGEVCQTLAIAAFALTQKEAGLFAISAAFGLGFSGIVPAYVLIIREFYPSSEASWRVPTMLFVSMGGMAFGSWWAGALYDHFGFYGPAFASGVIFNLANVTLIGFLTLRRGWGGGLRTATA